MKFRFYGGTWHDRVEEIDLVAPFVIVPVHMKACGCWRDQRYKLTKLDCGHAYVLEDRGREICFYVT